jgi:hypothetical protein
MGVASPTPHTRPPIPSLSCMRRSSRQCHVVYFILVTKRNCRADTARQPLRRLPSDVDVRYTFSFVSHLLRLLYCLCLPIDVSIHHSAAWYRRLLNTIDLNYQTERKPVRSLNECLPCPPHDRAVLCYDSDLCAKQAPGCTARMTRHMESIHATHEHR